MKNTHVFKLTSGVECEVTELLGVHQEILTLQDTTSHTDKLNKVLADVVQRVGSNTKIDEKFIHNMTVGDRKLALVNVRQFTFGHQDTFTFTHIYLNSEGEKLEYPVEVYLEDGNFPTTTMKILSPEGDIIPANFKEYEEVLEHKEVYIELPRSKQKIMFTMLDSKGEIIGLNTKKDQRSSHTMLYMRRPVYFHKKEGGKDTMAIKLDLNKLPYLDIEFLRKKIKEYEGDVDTEVMFEKPEDATGPAELTVDVLSTVAFFFPSEAL